MIPVPKYLIKNTTIIGEKENTIKLSYLCDCGNDSFTIFKIVQLKKATDEEYSYEFYSDAFSWIVVYGIDENGKRRKIFDYETA